MAKVDPSKVGRETARITQDDLEEDVAILTIRKYEEKEFTDAQGKQTRASLFFEETGELPLRVNKTQAGYLVEGLGDESNDWIGKQVPVEKTEAEFPMGSGKMHPVVWVCAPEQWARIFAEAGVTQTTKGRGKRARVAGVKKAKRGRK